ncbi:anti-sigma F factor [Caldalkalibacillus thermarum]|uniref:anti-sigma F factor n=1 Tax=Caldalkalibacillus thermarum TaxID=296745 RepID=UPI00166B7034|nr:anti-sigma F factor [Caldalkalibacillus thermarum]GGK15275.1 anti-sigma F factor [Caldalkalibacillus thermarum]
MAFHNKMELRFKAKSENEAFARVAVASFVSQLDPDLEQLTDIKTVVSEAVTNAIIHGYEENEEGWVFLSTEINDNEVTIIIRDEGQGIKDIEQARQPLFTTKPEMERSGMGFTIMENFMDHVEVSSEEGKGTTVKLVKKLTTNPNQALCN